MKFALFLVIFNTQPLDPHGPDMWWAIDGNMTESDCNERKAEMENHRAAMFGAAAETALVCDIDHAADEW